MQINPLKSRGDVGNIKKNNINVRAMSVHFTTDKYEEQFGNTPLTFAVTTEQVIEGAIHQLGCLT